MSIGLVVATGGPASAATDTTLFTMTGETGDYIAGPATYTYTPADATFSTQGTSGQAYFSVIQPGLAHWWYLDLRSPAGGDLVAGTTYTDAQRASFAVAPHPGLDVYGDGRGCNTVSGSFTVLEIARDADTGTITKFAATFEQHCEGGTAAARGAIYYHSSIPYSANASVTLGGAAQLPTGAPVSLTGVLSDGTNPIGSAALSVSRTDGSGTTNLPDVTTAANGSFTVTDTMPSSDASWTVHFAGNDSVQPLSATHVVTLGKYSSAIALTAPATATRGVAYRVTGVLTSNGAPLASTSVTFTRKDLAGTRSFSLVSNASGVVSYRDVPAVGGVVSWTLAYAGDDTHASASASKAVTVSRLATSVTIKTSATSYAYGARAAITVHLGTTYNRRDVYVYARPLGPTVGTAPGTLIAHVKVNSLGNAIIGYTMRARTTITVRFAGDYRYLAAARAVTANVVSKVSIEAGSYTSVSGGVYKYASGTAYFRSRPAPLRYSGCITFALQIYAAGRWQNAGSVCATIQPTAGYYAYAYTNRNYVGYKFRVRAYIGSNGYSIGSTSPWLYFMFV